MKLLSGCQYRPLVSVKPTVAPALIRMSVGDVDGLIDVDCVEDLVDLVGDVEGTILVGLGLVGAVGLSETVMDGAAVVGTAATTCWLTDAAGVLLVLSDVSPMTTPTTMATITANKATMPRLKYNLLRLADMLDGSFVGLGESESKSSPSVTDDVGSSTRIVISSEAAIALLCSRFGLCSAGADATATDGGFKASMTVKY